MEDDGWWGITGKRGGREGKRGGREGKRGGREGKRRVEYVGELNG